MKNSAVSRFSALFLFLLFILLFSLFFPHESRVLGAEAPGLNDPIGSRASNRISKGIHHLYNRDFEAAERIFRQVIVENPERPVGYFYRAMVSWSRLASGFWSPEVVKEYKSRIDKTIQVAEERIENQNPDGYDYFYLGGALGFMGRFELMKGEWITSFFLARNAIDAFETCLKKDRNNKDVLLGLGTFDYYTDRLSGVLKFLTYFLLHKGNKKQGLRRLHTAASEARYSATEAKSLLLHIYLFLEEDIPKALSLARDLSKRYPRNPRFLVLRGVSCIRLGNELEYRKILDLFRTKGEAASYSAQAALWKRRALYLEAIDNIYKGRYEKARAVLNNILKEPDSTTDPSMIAWPLLKIGMIHDLKGQREGATDYYNRVLKLRNGSGAQFMAKKLLKKPTEKGDPFLGY